MILLEASGPLRLSSKFCFHGYLKHKHCALVSMEGGRALNAGLSEFTSPPLSSGHVCQEHWSAALFNDAWNISQPLSKDRTRPMAFSGQKRLHCLGSEKHGLLRKGRTKCAVCLVCYENLLPQS